MIAALFTVGWFLIAMALCIAIGVLSLFGLVAVVITGIFGEDVSPEVEEVARAVSRRKDLCSRCDGDGCSLCANTGWASEGS